jgi:hypothetical protein
MRKTSSHGLGGSSSIGVYVLCARTHRVAMLIYDSAHV